MQKLGFLFPGQGSQFVGMGKKMAADHPIARATFEEADHVLGMKLSKICFEGPDTELTLTKNTQPAILTHSVAMFRVIEKETGVQPVLVAGHSLGEYSALVASGALMFADAVKAVQLRGQWMQEAVPAGQGGMLALVGVEEPQAHAFCEEVKKVSGLPGVFSVANLNGGGQVVVAGAKATCDWAAANLDKITSKPRRAIPLNVSAPFHCAMMKPAEEKLAAHLKTLKVNQQKCAYVANVDATEHVDRDGIVPRLISQVCSPVRWEASVKAMVGSGKVEGFWEVGPGKVLAGLVKRIEREAVVESKGATYDIEQ